MARQDCPQHSVHSLCRLRIIEPPDNSNYIILVGSDIESVNLLNSHLTCYTQIVVPKRSMDRELYISSHTGYRLPTPQWRMLPRWRPLTRESPANMVSYCADIWLFLENYMVERSLNMVFLHRVHYYSFEAATNEISLTRIFASCKEIWGRIDELYCYKRNVFSRFACHFRLDYSIIISGE